MVGKDGIMVDPQKIGAVTRGARPNDVRQLRSFLDFSNYFHRFIQGCLIIVVALIHLTRKDVKCI